MALALRPLDLAVADLGRLVHHHDHVHVVIGSLRNVNLVILKVCLRSWPFLGLHNSYVHFIISFTFLLEIWEDVSALYPG